jgi:hypothetical protein
MGGARRVARIGSRLPARARPARSSRRAANGIGRVLARLSPPGPIVSPQDSGVAPAATTSGSARRIRLQAAHRQAHATRRARSNAPVSPQREEGDQRGRAPRVERRTKYHATACRDGPAMTCGSASTSLSGRFRGVGDRALCAVVRGRVGVECGCERIRHAERRVAPPSDTQPSCGEAMGLAAQPCARARPIPWAACRLERARRTPRPRAPARRRPTPKQQRPEPYSSKHHASSGTASSPANTTACCPNSRPIATSSSRPMPGT